MRTGWLAAGATQHDESSQALGSGVLKVQLPVELLARLEASAHTENRTVEAEVRERLQRSLDEVPYRVEINPMVSIQNRDGSSTELTLEELAQRFAKQMVKEKEREKAKRAAGKLSP